MRSQRRARTQLPEMYYLSVNTVLVLPVAAEQKR
jgi:hypothetical protein